MKLIRVKTMGQVQAEKQSGKKLECRKYNTKYLSFGFTNNDVKSHDSSVGIVTRLQDG